MQRAWFFFETPEVTSAIFDATEIAALLIPNFSSAGNDFVNLYIQTANSLACSQNNNFSNEYVFTGTNILTES